MISILSITASAPAPAKPHTAVERRADPPDELTRGGRPLFAFVTLQPLGCRFGHAVLQNTAMRCLILLIAVTYGVYVRESFSQTVLVHEMVLFLQNRGATHCTAADI